MNKMYKLSIIALLVASASAFAPAATFSRGSALKASEYGKESDAAYEALLKAGAFTPLPDDAPVLTGGPEDLEEDYVDEE